MLVPVLSLLLLLFVARAPAADAAWAPPLDWVTVAAPFDFDAGSPFARGWHRGASLRGAPGAPVRAVCGGHVTFAGRLPAHGLGLTLRCGRLVATELGLERLTVARGARVRRAAVVGRLAPGGALWLGARVAGTRFGYRDPLNLLAPTAPQAPVDVVAPPRPEPVGGAIRRPAPPPGAPHAVGVPAWAGLALAATAAGAGIGRRHRRRTQRAPAPNARVTGR